LERNFVLFKKKVVLMMKKKKTLIVAMIFSSLLLINAYNLENVNSAGSFANLVFKTVGGGLWPDYGLFIAQYLRDIGIDVEVKVEEWSVFVGQLVATHDYDMAFVALTGGGDTPAARDVYTEEGSLNCFCLKRDIPYCNESENMQNLGVTIYDLDERQQLYYDWQQLMMDKILPLLPFFSPRIYNVLWSNIKGFDVRWGFSACCPYMSFDGLHEGQESLDEWNTAKSFWIELNPLLMSDAGSFYIFMLGDDPLLVLNPDLVPVKTGLIEDWEQISEYHYKFTMRNNVL
jgi:ABC-type transport system substrate-binding protein